jgi:hypothetical protein
MSEQSDLPIIVKWMDFLKWILMTTEKFPKSSRFSFALRIINLAFDVLECLIEARYSKSKLATLRRANIQLEKLRFIMRISFESKFISHKSHEHAMRSLIEVGKMLGGWIKQQEDLKTDAKRVTI